MSHHRGRHRLHIIGQHMVAAGEEGPGTRGLLQTQRGTRREAGGPAPHRLRLGLYGYDSGPAGPAPAAEADADPAPPRNRTRKTSR